MLMMLFSEQLTFFMLPGESGREKNTQRHKILLGCDWKAKCRERKEFDLTKYDFPKAQPKTKRQKFQGQSRKNKQRQFL